MNSFWQVLLCKFIFKSKKLVTGHSGPGWDEKWNLWLKPDVFVATTQPTAIWAKRVCSWTKVVTIPYGIDVYKNIKPLKLDLEKPIILCVAAAVEYKRVDLAIRAVARLEKGSLLYVGTGPLLSELNQLGEKLLGKRYLNMAVSYQDMPAIYQSCDIVTLPSKPQENSPMVFLEAMAAGKIVVTTENPRSEWVLRKMGVYVDPENLEEYSKALSVRPKDFVNEVSRFSWDQVVGEYLKVFQK